MTAGASWPVESLEVSVFKVPTATPESDGTYTWHATTVVVVELVAGGECGLGYTYASASAGALIQEQLKSLVLGRSAMDVRGAWDAMCAAVRNLGQAGICRMAISAVDTALWDLKARLLNLPLVSLFGAVREAMPLYGSGLFTNYDDGQMEEQLRGWLRQGFTRVKMKIGRDPAADRSRVATVRQIVGAAVELFVDANGAYSRKLALAQAESFAEQGVVWFEEPVSSEDLDGLRLLRDRVPAGIEVAAGEYGFDGPYFLRMLEAGAVDVLQADVTRCGGYTGFLQAAALCDVFHVPLSAHCAPALHLPLGCACSRFRHAEFFVDHARIESMLFTGSPEPVDGHLQPNLSLAGHGLGLKRAAAEPFAA